MESCAWEAGSSGPGTVEVEEQPVRAQVGAGQRLTAVAVGVDRSAERGDSRGWRAGVAVTVRGRLRSR